MKTLIFIHGANSHLTKQEYLNWLKSEYPNWLAEEWKPYTKKWKQYIAERFISEGERRVFMPQMPSDLNAKYEEWLLAFEGLMSQIDIDDEFILVGHSLGGCFLLKYFSDIGICHSEERRICPDNQEQILPIVSMTGKRLRIHQIHLLAACISEGDFTPPSNYEYLQELGSRVHIWHAEDDAIVPFSVGQELAKILPEAESHFFGSEKGYGHFSKIERIPELESVIFKI